MEQAPQQDIRIFSSSALWKPIINALQAMGQVPPKKFRVVYYFSCAMALAISYSIPISLVVNIFFLDSRTEIFSNLSQSLVEAMCSFKVSNLIIKSKKLFQLRDRIFELDSRVDRKDVPYMNYIVKTGQRFLYSFAIMFALCTFVCFISVLMEKKQRLMFSGWIPWNYSNSTSGYSIACSYQIVGGAIQVFYSFICDTYLGLIFWMLQGHLKTLGMRVMRIGYDTKMSAKQNYRELINCIEDHRKCLVCFKICQDISSRIMLLQFVFTECDLCMSALYFLFLNDDLFETVYVIILCVCIIIQISLCCYAGSELSEESGNLTRALYSCNWMDQDKKFKKVLIIFMQHTQKPWTILAGGIVTVSVDTWLTVLKTSYSLYAVASQMV